MGKRSTQAPKAAAKKVRTGKKIRSGNNTFSNLPWLRLAEIPWLQNDISDELPSCVHTWNKAAWLRKVDELNIAQTREEKARIIAESHKEAEVAKAKADAAARRQAKEKQQKQQKKKKKKKMSHEK
jgi:hypothetical protein